MEEVPGEADLQGMVLETEPGMGVLEAGIEMDLETLEGGIEMDLETSEVGMVEDLLREETSEIGIGEMTIEDHHQEDSLLIGMEVVGEVPGEELGLALLLGEVLHQGGVDLLREEEDLHSGEVLLPGTSLRQGEMVDFLQGEATMDHLAVTLVLETGGETNLQHLEMTLHPSRDQLRTRTNRMMGGLPSLLNVNFPNSTGVTRGVSFAISDPSPSSDFCAGLLCCGSR